MTEVRFTESFLKGIKLITVIATISIFPLEPVKCLSGQRPEGFFFLMGWVIFLLQTRQALCCSARLELRSAAGKPPSDAENIMQSSQCVVSSVLEM